ncbi:curli assembly protein CsgF [Halanaerobium hydrogeniformans]|uniref:Curli production assembly/transport component CsgF n=1 Tax=Halanaerobium hydrogeniformans TaxID=656519 RepID=E4RJ03_HALHG|nr:curli assembly protein CsgF [Halanaerobium hydrogeniformans]ADQ15223.1 hypothetical protein Halsa_1805 [Halanaerobium hydrogeniformans]
MKKLFVVVITICIFFFLSGVSQAANYTMSWDFQYFNNPNARQVAINIAEKQAGMITEDISSYERFRASLEQRLLSSVQRSIIRQLLNEEEFKEIEDLRVGDLIINITEGLDGEVIVTIEDRITGDKTTLTYNSFMDDYNDIEF